jgi:hypothetical protein
MVVKTDVALINMIQNKAVFLDLIDHMDKVGEGDEVRIVMYQQKLRALLDSVAPLPSTRVVREVPAERRKLESALCIENLERVGLVIQVDSARGVMVFAPFVIEMFRHFDGARLRHLNSADYELIRASFNRLYEVFITLPSLNREDIGFQEQVSVLRKEIRAATAKMKECVDALQGRLQRLGEIVDQMRYDVIDEVAKAQEALGEINSIYLRNILPALQFLGEHTDLKGTKPALTALTCIGDQLAHYGHDKLASSVYYSVESIRSYRHDISIISGSLMRYVQQSEAHRRAYDKIEQAWNRLYGGVRELHDGSLKDNILPSTHPVFARLNTYSGLKMRVFEAKLEWPDANQRLALAEHLRTTLPNIKISSGKIHQLGGQSNESGELKRRRDARLLAIGNLVEEWEPRLTDDAHVAMHEHLKERLKGYELTDLLMSVGWLRKREGIFLIPRYQIGNLATDCESLRYYKLQVETEHA